MLNPHPEIDQNSRKVVFQSFLQSTQNGGEHQDGMSTRGPLVKLLQEHFSEKKMCPMVCTVGCRPKSKPQKVGGND